MKYAIVDRVNLAFDGFYDRYKDAKGAYERIIRQGSTDIMLIEVVESKKAPKLPNENHFSKLGFTKKL